MSSDGDVIRCVAPWPGTAARLLEGFASLGPGLWNLEQICAASGTGIEPGDAVQVLAALSITSVCATGDAEDTWRSQLTTVELLRLAQMLKGADHYRRLRTDSSSLELAVTMPLPPSRLEQELTTSAGRPGGYLATTAAFSRIARAAKRRLVVLTPFIDAGGFLWLRRTFESTDPQVQRILILREADKYAIELSVEHADWLQAMNICVGDYRVAHDPNSGRQLPFETFHAKIVLSDENLAYVGSANFLGSSEAFTLETGVLIDGRAAAQVSRLIEAVLRVARRI
jgi:hypothetical protein